MANINIRIVEEALQTTYCDDENCSIKDTCARYRVSGNEPCLLIYYLITPRKNNQCEMFINKG